MAKMTSFFDAMLDRLPAVQRIRAERDSYRREADALSIAAASGQAKAIECQAHLDGLTREAAQLRAEVEQLKLGVRFMPSGHFYSPFPSLEELARDEHRIFGPPPRELPGIDLRERHQLDLLERLAGYYRDLPFGQHRLEGLRYYYENPTFSYSDAICLYGMLRLARPRRVIEVGSGYSSCVMLDTSDLFLGGGLQATFIEPYPDVLLSLLKPGDTERVRILAMRVQDVELREFESLESGDVLFIDSSHVSKAGSDVNWLFFEVLPRLAHGVYVHVHDVQYPFEYPQAWIREGRAWNEAYLVRAFLQYNSGFRVVLMNSYMACFHEAFFRTYLPLCLKNRGGSLWLQRS